MPLELEARLIDTLARETLFPIYRKRAAHIEAPFYLAGVESSMPDADYAYSGGLSTIA